MKGEYVSVELVLCPEALFLHVSRPNDRAGEAVFFELAGLDVMFDELHVLRKDAIAVFAQRDFVDLENGLGLFDVGLGLKVADLLHLLFVVKGRRIELGDDVSGLDPRSFGDDFEDSGRARLFLFHHHAAAAAAPTAAATSTTSATASSAATTAALTLLGFLLGRRGVGGLRRRAQRYERGDRVGEAPDDRL